MKTLRILQFLAVSTVASTAAESLDKRIVEPIDLVQISAAAGDPSAQFNLALSLQKGERIGKDINAAVQWYRKAAQAGFPEAQFNLGVLYANGVEVGRDDKEAAKWFYAAAQNGFFQAQMILTEFYVEGRGVEKNLATALAWDFVARHTLELRYGGDAGSPPRPGKPRIDAMAPKDDSRQNDAWQKAYRKSYDDAMARKEDSRQNAQRIGANRGVYRRKVDLASMLRSLEKIEDKAHNFAGVTDQDYQRAQIGAQAYVIPLAAAPQKPGPAHGWMREQLIGQTSLKEMALLPVSDDRSRQIPLGYHGRTVIKRHSWRHAEADHFVVHFVNEPEAKLTMQFIEGVYFMVTTLLNIDPRLNTKKSHVFIFSDKGDWEAYLKNIGQPSEVIGFAYKTELLLNGKQGREDAIKTICHEVTHALIARFYPGRKPPLWVNEGLAEYIAARTVAVKRGQSVEKYLSSNADARMDIVNVVERNRYYSETMKPSQSEIPGSSGNIGFPENTGNIPIPGSIQLPSSGGNIGTWFPGNSGNITFPGGIQIPPTGGNIGTGFPGNIGNILFPGGVQNPPKAPPSKGNLGIFQIQIPTQAEEKAREEEERHSIATFYANSEKCVRVLCEKLPIDGFPRLLNALIAGNLEGPALAIAYGKQCDSLSALEVLVNSTTSPVAGQSRYRRR
jgi:hypothetical protein